MKCPVITAGFWADTRSGGMVRTTKLLCASFILLEAVDAFLTMWATSTGYVEVNPLVASIASTWIMPTCKILPAIGVSFLMVWLARRFPKVAAGAMMLVVSFMVWVIGSNLTEMI